MIQRIQLNEEVWFWVNYPYGNTKFAFSSRQDAEGFLKYWNITTL
jgi:hypothetical protein